MSSTEAIILERAARELQRGDLVNLGIGLPTRLPAHLPTDHGIVFHSENGVVGLGNPRPDETPDHPVIDAGGGAYELAPGAACFDSALSFGIVRGGHLDVAMLGAFEVSVEGDLANWMIPGRIAAGMGGAMELAQRARRVIVTTRFANKQGHPKLKRRCELPLTARGCVDLLITERAVFKRDPSRERLRLTSVHPDHDPNQILAALPEDLLATDPLEPW
jgi:3-oxoacid CoA-transferase B subunit